MEPQSLVASLARQVRESRGVGHKADIAAVTRRLGFSCGDALRVGDDCAAIPDGDGYLLLAIEGFLDEFVGAMPWFAGWCGVMVNLSDIAAMGGRPVAVLDAVWSRDAEHADPILRGLGDAARAYGVPVVGGHTNTRGSGERLAVAVCGRASRLLTSFDAKPGDTLIAAIDLRGEWHEPHPFWDAATRGAPAARLRGDLAVLPALAEAGLSRAAKDISMAGLPGTALMLAECSGIGITIELDTVPAPDGVDLGRWLAAFPSYGFLLTAASPDVPAVLAAFEARGIAAASVGRCEAGSHLDLVLGQHRARCWDHAQAPLMGLGLT